MGAYCPVPHIGQDILQQTNDTIAQPIANALVKEGYQFFGVLYIYITLQKTDTLL